MRSRPSISAPRRVALTAAAALVAALSAAGPAAAAQPTFAPWSLSPFERFGAASGLSLLERVDVGPGSLPGLVALSGQNATYSVRAAPEFSPELFSGPIAGGTDLLSEAASGDVNGDGRRDLVTWTTFNASFTWKVFLAGAGGLTPSGAPGAAGSENAGSSSSGIAVGDVNGDGRADLVFTRATTGTTVRFGTAAGGFATTGPATSTVGGADVAAADVNADGRADVILSGTDGSGPFVRALAGPGLGDLGPILRPGTAPLRVDAADVDGDGRADAVLTRGGGTVTVHPARAAGGFGDPITAQAPGATGTGLAVADFDRDGNTDLVAATGATDRVTLAPGNDPGGFDAPGDVPLDPAGLRGRGPVGGMVAADFDGDGDDDLAISSRAGYRVDVLRNTTDPRPVVRTFQPSATSAEAAVLAGSVRTRGLAGSVHAEWGEGNALTQSTPPVALEAGRRKAVPVSAPIDGLRPETTYRVRVVATTAAGTANGEELLFRTAAAGTPDATLGMAATPQVVVSGAPIPFRAEVNGTYPPYTVAWTFGSSGQPAETATGASVDHRFAPLPSGDAARIKDGSAASAVTARPEDKAEGAFRRGTYDVSVVATDRLGRATAPVTRQVTVVPNRAPSTSVIPLVTPLEYAEDNLLASGSQDPDTSKNLADPVDRVVREEWSIDGRAPFTRDPGLPTTARNCFGAGTLTGCTEAGMSGEAVGINPWRDDRAGRQPIAGFADRSAHPDFDVEPRRSGESWGAYNARQTLAATALKLYPSQFCNAPEESMTGCWPFRTSARVSLRAIDTGGRETTVVKDVPIRPRARPAADVTLRFPDPGTNTGKPEAQNEPLAGPISAQDPADRENTGTVLEFDPGTTIVDDGREQAVWYSVQIGRPWARGCGKGSVAAPIAIEPQLREAAISVARPDPIDQLPGGLGIEGVGVIAKRYALRQRAVRASGAAAHRAAVTSSLPGSTAPAADVQPIGKENGCREGFGVDRVIASVVSQDPKALRLTIPEPGKWSALLTVYDRAAGTSRVRLDGLSVTASSVVCANVTGALGSGKRRFNFTGSCVSSTAGKDGQRVAWTRNAMDVNGVRVAPAPGHYLVADGRGRPSVYSASSVPKTVDSTGLDAWTPAPDKAKASILVDDQPLLKVGLYGVLKLDGATKLSGFEPEADLRYGGLPAAKVKGTVDLTRACSAGGRDGLGSSITFELRLPSAFAQQGATPTRPVAIPGCNTGSDTLITKKADTASRSRLRAGAITLTPKGRRNASRIRGVRADLPGGTIDLPLAPAQVGPVSITSLKLSYDPASNTFTGDGEGVVVPGIPVSLHVAIVDGELAEVSGSAKVAIQLGSTPTQISELRFKLKLAPKLVLVGGATVTSSDGFAVKANGDITLETSPLKLSLDGNASLLGGAVPLAAVHAEIGDGKAAVNAQTGSSVGSFSYSLTVGGAFSAKGFNIEGAGRACIFACLGVQGILSSKGAAVCGEIDLWVKTLRPGLGITWKPFDVDAYFDGCGLGPYRADLGRAAALAPGQSEAIPVVQGQGALSVAARSDQPGIAPNVTLRSPDGKTVVGTPAGADASAFTQATSSLVDVDRVSGETRFLVANPTPGRWTLTPEAGSATVAEVKVARDEPLPTKAAFRAKTSAVSAKDATGGVTYGSLLTATTRPAPQKVAKVLPRKAPKKAKGITKARAGRIARAARLATPGQAVIDRSLEQMGPRLNPAALGPDLAKLRRKLAFDVDLGGSGVVTFVERGADTAQSLASFAVPEDGRVAAEFAFLPGLTGDRKRSIDAYVLSERGIPRGIVRDVDTFTAPAPPKPRFTVGARAQVSNRKVAISTAKVPGSGSKSSAPVAQALVRTKAGAVTAVTLTGRDFKRRGGRYVATVPVTGAASGGTVTIKPIDVRGNVVKGKQTLTIKR